MAVYYRYRSGVDTFSVPVASPSISVGELKRLILGTSRHGHGRTRGRGPREGIAISNPQTGEEFTDNSALVLRNSTVVVRRVAGSPAETIVAAATTQRPIALQDGYGSSSSRSSASEDEENKAISAVIDAAELKWDQEDSSRRARCYGPRGGAPPPAGYVCRRCRVPGHFIQHCPTNGDPRFDLGRSTVSPPVAGSPDDEDGIPEDLHCKICKKVMADAVMTSKCCFSSFCDRCIRAQIVGNSKCACGARARADDLIPNPALRTTIANMLAARATSASSSGTEKQRSNATTEPAPPSPASSQESRRSHVSSKKATASESEHSDGSGSTSTISAVHQVQETADRAEARSDHHYGYSAPIAPARYDPFIFGAGGMPWPADPSMYYGGMPYAYGGGYPMPMGPHHFGAVGTMEASYGYNGRKRTGGNDQRYPVSGPWLQEKVQWKQQITGRRSSDVRR